MIKLTKEHQDHIWKLSTDKKKEKEQIVKNLWDSKKTEDQKNAALLTELGKVTQVRQEDSAALREKGEGEGELFGKNLELGFENGIEFKYLV